MTTAVAVILGVVLSMLSPGVHAAQGEEKADDKKASVAGTWALAIKGPAAHGDVSAGLVLAQRGSQVTGTFSAHGADRSVKGEFKESTLTLSTGSGDTNQDLTLTAKLKTDGTLAGYLSGPMGDMQWTASRARDK